MLYRILADMVVLSHFLWILFLLFGVFIGVRYKTVRIIHFSGWVFAIVLQVFDWYCPLTHLEVWLRGKYDPALSYSGSFIIHYIEKIVYIGVSPRMILVSSILLFSITSWLYFRKTKEANGDEGPHTKKNHRS